MKIFVCVKQVPDTETKLKLAAGGASVDFTGVKWVLNPYDEFAVEEALKLKATKPEAIVTAISVGPKARVSESLRTALAMGADEAIVVDGPENLDSYATAKVLAAALKAEGFDLVFSGKGAIDDNQMAVTQMVAELLGVPHANVVSKFEFKGTTVFVEREADGGTHEKLELRLPAIVGANKGLNTPRYASLPGIMKAKKKTIKELSWDGLGVSASDVKTSFAAYVLPPERPSCKMLTGDPGAQAQALAQLLRTEAKVI